MRNFVVWLAGGQPDFLRRFPGDRVKHVVIGSTVLFTAMMACVSMSFALRIALRAPLPIAIVFGVAWGIGILAIDRMLIVSLTRPVKRGWGYALVAASRFAFALLLGFVISIPFTLRIFAPEINAQVTTIHQQKWDAYLAAQASGPEGGAITAAQKAIAADNATISSGVPANAGSGSSSALVALQSQLSTLEQEAQTAHQTFTCDLYGGPGCPPPGQGPSEKTEYQQYLDDESQIGIVEGEITAEQQAEARSRTTSRNNAEKKLAADEGNLSKAEAQQATDEATFKTANDTDDGLLIQLTALDQLTSGGGIAGATHWLLFFLFAIFECLPVLVKLVLNTRESPYDQAVLADETSRLADVKAEKAAEEADRNRHRRERTVMTDAQDDAWSLLIPQIASETADQRREVYQELLRRWRAEILGAPRPAGPAGHAPPDPLPAPLLPPPAPAAPAGPAGSWTRTGYSGSPAPSSPAPSAAPRGRRRLPGWPWAAGHGYRRRGPRGGRPAAPGPGLPGLPGTYTAIPAAQLTVLRQPPSPATAQGNGLGAGQGRANP
jgi:hypothetical protein